MVSKLLFSLVKRLPFRRRYLGCHDRRGLLIFEIDVGDRALAWDEAGGATDYYTVTDAYTSVHEVLVYMTIDGEDLTTTPEHPFLQADGNWTPAGELAVGNAIRRADGENPCWQDLQYNRSC